jgi:hypothetical protein
MRRATMENETKTWKEFDEKYPTTKDKLEAQGAVIRERRRTDEMDLHDERVAVCEGMTRYGGGFVKALGAALIQADMQNVQRFKSTWPDYWSKYLRMGKEHLKNTI